MWNGADEITDFMVRVHVQCGYTLHRISNVVVERVPDGGRSRCYVEHQPGTTGVRSGYGEHIEAARKEGLSPEFLGKLLRVEVAPIDLEFVAT